MAVINEDNSGILIDHIQPELKHILTLPRALGVLVLAEVVAWIFLPGWSESKMGQILFGLSLPVILWLIVHRIVMRTIFSVPMSENLKLRDPRWSPFRYSGWGGDVLTAHFLEADEGIDDVAIIVHGWGSSLARAESRALHLVDMGISVVGMNIRGHGGCDRRQDWTILKVIDDMDALMSAVVHQFDGRMPKRVWLYGHSLGGYISLWMAAEPKGWWKKLFSGIILESPATSFPLVIESLVPTNLRLIMPWVRQTLRREHLRIHPDLSVRYANAQVPYFGLPKVPILVLQAARDDRLGSAHLQLLLPHLDESATIQMLESQPHTSGVDSEERKVRLEEWLKPRIDNSTSVLV